MLGFIGTDTIFSVLCIVFFICFVQIFKSQKHYKIYLLIACIALAYISNDLYRISLHIY